MKQHPMRRIILTRSEGQLGNKLAVGSHVLAAAVESGATFINPTFLQYSDWFEGTRNCFINWTASSTRQQTYSQRQRKIMYAATRVAWRAGWALAPLSGYRIVRVRAPHRQPQDLKSVLAQTLDCGATTLLLQGFEFRHAPWVEKHAALLRAFFLPCQEYRVAAEQTIAHLRKECDVLVAVHLRHGDYRTYMGGCYFWPVAVYRSFIDRMRELLAPKRVGFLICSNAQQEPTCFDGLVWRPGPGSVPADLFAISLCDYIVGPPSTFSAWAAFYGDTRLLHVVHSEQEFSLNDFAVRKAP